MMNNENGRSMVEMLGVLAIIGVLSVAGIAGYSMAMKKYRANEIVNTASQLAILAQAQNQGMGGTADLSTIGLNSVAGATNMEASCGSSGCTVNVTGADNDVMNQAKAMVGNNGVSSFYTLN